MSEKSCWIILPKEVTSQYRSETLLKQISLQVFLSYCSNNLVVGFVVNSERILSDFSRSRSSDWSILQKNVFLKNFRIKRTTLVPESSSKFAECFKKETLAQLFLCKFCKIFKICFVEAVLRTSTILCFWNS